MDYTEPMNKVKERMKELQAENAKLKARIEEIIKTNPETLRSLDRTGFKLGMQEANNYTEKQNLDKERQVKEEELKDWKKLLESNKDDLLKRKQELSQTAEELKKTHDTFNAEKEKLYEELVKFYNRGFFNMNRKAKDLKKRPNIMMKLLNRRKLPLRVKNIVSAILNELIRLGRTLRFY